MLATAKRARQLIARQNRENMTGPMRPLSEAVSELEAGKIKILSESEPGTEEE